MSCEKRIEETESQNQSIHYCTHAIALFSRNNKTQTRVIFRLEMKKKQKQKKKFKNKKKVVFNKRVSRHKQTRNQIQTQQSLKIILILIIYNVSQLFHFNLRFKNNPNKKSHKKTKKITKKKKKSPKKSVNKLVKTSNIVLIDKQKHANRR